MKGSLTTKDFGTETLVKAGNVFNLATNGQVTKALAGSTGGTVKEVFYRVYYKTEIDLRSKTSSGRYVIDSIYADFVTQSAPASGNFEQKFGIEFIPSTKAMEPVGNTPVGSKIVQRSGNPGYELNSNLIVGQKPADHFTVPATPPAARKGLTVNFGGFSAYAATSNGICETVVPNQEFLAN